MKKIKISTIGEWGCRNMNKDMGEDKVVREDVSFSHRKYDCEEFFIFAAWRRMREKRMC